MKKLFAIRDTRTNKTLPDLFFSDKMAAKRKRAELNSDGEHYVVTPGPDHYKRKEKSHE